MGARPHPLEGHARRRALEGERRQALVIQTSSAENSAAFLKAATASKSSPEYKDLYFHFLRRFTDAVATMTGVIDAGGFDQLIDIAATTPRKYSVAPSSSAMFKSEEGRRASCLPSSRPFTRTGTAPSPFTSSCGGPASTPREGAGRRAFCLRARGGQGGPLPRGQEHPDLRRSFLAPEVCRFCKTAVEDRT